MSEEEAAEVERLIEEHGNENVTLTRRDPGESGPLVVQFSDGQVFIVGEE